MLDAMKPFAAKFLPIIFNCLLETSPALRQYPIACIRAYSTLATKDVMVKVYAKAEAKFLDTVYTEPIETQQALMDVLIGLAPALPAEQSTQLFNTVVKPYITAKEGGMQKKVYSLLHVLLKDATIEEEHESIIILLAKAGNKVKAAGKHKR